ncbi:MAG: phage shock protein PspA [Gammaproteobacteria bacterium]|nr:phage shock protein PspA [Gammaproteobacteria bacterium]NND59270.1 phage shock protein PspA [Gammaproteobacteria bacterium]
MGIFSRFTDIVNSNLNAILEKAEDPEKMVRLMIQEMEDTLVEVRSAAARAIADKKELNRRLDALDREEADWQRKAELAVTKGRDDLAKAAIAEKQRVSEAIAAVRGDYQAIDDGLTQLNDDIARLEDKLGDAKTRQKALIMRAATATKRLEVRKQLHETKIDDALVRFEAYERRMEDLEGRVESYDLGRSKDLKHEFVDLETDESVEAELEELKQRLTHSSQS